MPAGDSTEKQLSVVRTTPDQEGDVVRDPAADRRADRRLTVSELSWLNHARLKYGPDVSLIDLSGGGAQFETTSYPLQPASTVVIELAAGGQTWPLPARVLRCQITSLTPHPTYRGAVAFKRPFDLQEIAGVAEANIDVNPIHEYARLRLALKRLTEGNAAGMTPLSATGATALGAAFAMIESARGRESAAPFVNEIGRILRVLTASLDDATTARGVVPQIIKRLHRSVPSQIVRMVDAGHVPLIRNDAVTFRVPIEGVEEPERLVIEFPRDCALEMWHLQLLEAAAHLITVTRDVTSSRERPQPVEAATQIRLETEPAAPAGWNRLVVRYVDGRLLKGYGRDFLPARGSVDLWNDPGSVSESPITIPFAHLKAVFFVHDFEGNPAHSPSPDADDPSARGRRITVTFVDGEVLRGVTLGYQQNAPGFFVSPLDSSTNNLKMFVLAGAIRHVQFQDSANRTSAPQMAAAFAG